MNAEEYGYVSLIDQILEKWIYHVEDIIIQAPKAFLP